VNIARSVAQVAIAAADALERTAGPRAALAAWRRLAAQSVGDEARATAILRGHDCAVGVGDDATASELASLWPTVTEGDHFARVAERCARLARSGKLALARGLATAEAQRSRSARALYLSARCLELTGDSSCVHVASDAAERAAAEGLPEIEAAARARRVAWLARREATLPAAVEEASRVDTSHLRPTDRLAMADALLRAPSRFARATGLDLLDRVAQADDAPLATRARDRALAHADDAWPRLSPLELDRLLALLGRSRDASRAEHDRVALRELLEARTPSEPDDASRLACAVVEALAAGRPADALDALSAAALRVELERRAPCTTWTAAEAGLGAEEAAVREGGHRLARQLLAHARSVPPRGFAPLADALDAAGFRDLAIEAARAAVAQHESAAAALLGRLLRARGWALALEGAKLGALESLREAHRLLV
jgi:hypothetical protein